MRFYCIDSCFKVKPEAIELDERCAGIEPEPCLSIHSGRQAGRASHGRTSDTRLRLVFNQKAQNASARMLCGQPIV